MKVKEIMTMGAVRTRRGYNLRDTSRFMLKHRLNSLPVVDDEDKVIGIITQADIFRTILPSYDETHEEEAFLNFDQIEKRAEDAAMRKVEDVMSTPAITVDEDTPVVKAGSIMLLKGIKQLPVLRGERPVGVVTFTDILEALIVSTPKC